MSDNGLRPARWTRSTTALERCRRILRPYRSNWPGPNPETKTQDLMSILEWSPAGSLMDVNDAGRSAGSGDYVGAATGLASIGLPGAPPRKMGRKVFDLDYFG